MRKWQLEGEEAGDQVLTQDFTKNYVVWGVSPRFMALSSFRYSLGTTEQQTLGDEGGHKRYRFPGEPIPHLSRRCSKHSNQHPGLLCKGMGFTENPRMKALS